MSVEAVSFADFKKICRLCLSKTTMYPIERTEIGGIPVAELIEYSVTLNLNKSDLLPSNICAVCSDNLYKFFQFKKLCFNSEAALECIISSTEIKAEDDDERHRKSEETTTQDIKTEIECSENEECTSNDVVNIKAEIEENCEDSPENAERKMYKCQHCNFATPTISNLGKHCKAKNHPNEYKCSYCPKTFLMGSKLRKHMVWHSNPKPYKCDLCEQRFNTQTILRRHLRIHTGERPYICHICNKDFVESGTLRAHMKVHASEEEGAANLTCPHCGLHFQRRQRRRYQNHLMKHTGEESEEPRNHLCEICARSFTQKASLKRHKAVKHEQKEKNYLCTVCGKAFITRNQLSMHAKSHNNRKKYYCDICDKHFAYYTHVLTHTNYKQFKCDVCAKSFRTKESLRNHMRTHTGEKPFVCQFCNKGFALKTNLNVHERLHTGEKPVLCPECGKGFRHRATMMRHRITHSNAKEETCNEDVS